MAAVGVNCTKFFLLAGGLPVDAVEILAWTCLGLPVGRANARFSYFYAKFSGNPAHFQRRFFGDGIGIKTSATASSYVFAQQELARGLRLSQPSRVAKTRRVASS